jgi:hypothetical protein
MALGDPFSEQYKSKYKNRNLQLLSFLGQVTLTVDRGRLELSVSTLQATILLSFNTASEIPLNSLRLDILKDTILDDDLFEQLLQPLLSNVLDLQGDNLRVKGTLPSGCVNAYSSLRDSSKL